MRELKRLSKRRNSELAHIAALAGRTLQHFIVKDRVDSQMIRKVRREFRRDAEPAESIFLNPQDKMGFDPI